jgi:hypothetical protein
LALALLPAEVGAHAFGQRYDLPLPLALWLAAAGATVAFSFVVLALVLRRSANAVSYPRLDLLRVPGARGRSRTLLCAARLAPCRQAFSWL